MEQGTISIDAGLVPENAPLVPISWGELYDKIAILEIKERELQSERQLANVRRELAALRACTHQEDSEQLADLLTDLRDVNLLLWQHDEAIRLKEREKDFSEEFVALARAIYQQNDRRAAVKHRINRLLASGLSEEKSYKAY